MSQTWNGQSNNSGHVHFGTKQTFMVSINKAVKAGWHCAARPLHTCQRRGDQIMW